MLNLTQLPENLPIPEDDGACDHLQNKPIPDLALQSTQGSLFELAAIKTRLVIYCYPMTGRPDTPLPEGWDDIPGARGCTPQSCAFRDHYQTLQALGAEVTGLSTQSPAYQKEMADRLHLPFPVLSDEALRFQQALALPTFEVAGMTLLKRVTLIVNQGIIEAVHYPIFPSHSDAAWVIAHLENRPSARK